MLKFKKGKLPRGVCTISKVFTKPGEIKNFNNDKKFNMQSRFCNKKLSRICNSRENSCFFKRNDLNNIKVCELQNFKRQFL